MCSKPDITASGDDDDQPTAKKRKVDEDGQSKNSFGLLDFSDTKKFKMATDVELSKGYSYAYVHHLWDTGEFLGKTLLVMHNLRFLNDFCNKLLK